jgi:hypothetical protein
VFDFAPASFRDEELGPEVNTQIRLEAGGGATGSLAMKSVRTGNAKCGVAAWLGCSSDWTDPSNANQSDGGTFRWQARTLELSML